MDIYLTYRRDFLYQWTYTWQREETSSISGHIPDREKRLPLPVDIYLTERRDFLYQWTYTWHIERDFLYQWTYTWQREETSSISGHIPDREKRLPLPVDIYLTYRKRLPLPVDIYLTERRDFLYQWTYTWQREETSSTSGHIPDREKRLPLSVDIYLTERRDFLYQWTYTWQREETSSTSGHIPDI